MIDAFERVFALLFALIVIIFCAFRVFTCISVHFLRHLVVHSKSSRGLNLVATNPNSAYNALEYAFVSGFGFGFMSSLVSFISALAESIGPGFLPCPSCPNVSTYFIYAVTTLLFNMLHIIWMVIAFDSFIKKDWKGPVAVFLYHVAASYLVRRRKDQKQGRRKV